MRGYGGQGGGVHGLGVGIRLGQGGVGVAGGRFFIRFNIGFVH